MKATEISVTELSRNLSEYLNRAAYGGESFVLIRGNRALAEMRPLPRCRTLGDLSSLLDTLPGLGPAEAAVMERTTLTRNLAPLERERLVTSGPGADRRQRIVHLLPRGKRKLDAALPLWRLAQKRQSDRLGERRKERLLRDLRFAAREDG